MSNHYDAPAEVRELEKAINQFSYKYGLDTINVFRDLLRYIIHGFTIPGYPGYTDWRYSPQQNQEIHAMMQEWIKIMDKQVSVRGWFDAFGDLFMALASRSSKSAKGQFFTPSCICDLSTAITTPKPFDRVGDPAGGSGRYLLSAKTIQPRIWCFSQDVDYLCCLMAVCNMLIHGCVGEVVCMNTISNRNFQGAWLINEFLFRTGCPSIRPLTEEEYRAFDAADYRTALLLDQEGHDAYMNFRKVWAIVNKFENYGQKESVDNL